jgi:hypothetical protein
LELAAREAPHRTIGSAIRPLPGSAEERTALVEAFAGTQENITQTAQELGVSRVTLYRMLRRHTIMLNRGLKTPPVAGCGQAAFAKPARLTALPRIDHGQSLGQRRKGWRNRAFGTAGDRPGAGVADHQPRRGLGTGLEHPPHFVAGVDTTDVPPPPPPTL